MNILPRQRLCNLPTRLNPSNHDQSIPSLRNRLTDDVCALRLALRSNNIRLSLLLCLFYDKPRSLRILLRDLLLLHGFCEFLAEGHVRYGDVFEGNVEFGSSFKEVGADPRGDGFSLGDEFCGVELGDDGFEDFVTDGGEDALIVVEAEGLGGVSVGLGVERGLSERMCCRRGDKVCAGRPEENDLWRPLIPDKSSATSSPPAGVAP